MTPQQIALVRRSFSVIAGRHTQVTDTFRGNVVRADPALAAMFDGDEDGQQLMQTFGAVVALLNKPEFLIPALERLGRRLGHGVSAAQVCAVGRAVMQTLEQALGKRWDAPTEGAWTAMYALVSMTVLSALVGAAADDEAAAPPPQRGTRTLALC